MLKESVRILETEAKTLMDRAVWYLICFRMMWEKGNRWK